MKLYLLHSSVKIKLLQLLTQTDIVSRHSGINVSVSSRQIEIFHLFQLGRNKN